MIKVREDLTGKKFGKLTVVKQIEDYVGKNNRKESQWLCVCSCPEKNMVKVTRSNLKTGNTKSCGCLIKNNTNKARVREDLTGIIFGRLKVLGQTDDYIKPNGTHESRWLCECSCEKHSRIKVIGHCLKNGNTKSCGCLNKEFISNLNKSINQYDLNGNIGVGYFVDGTQFYFDIEDYDKIKDYYWLNNHGYATSREQNDGKIEYIYMHRLIMNASSDEIIDHIDRNKLNNRKNNLRTTNDCGNARNTSLAKNNTSGVIGVSFVSGRNKWIAQITVNYQNISLGRYISKEDAIVARLKAEKEYFGEFAPQRHLFEQYNIK